MSDEEDEASVNEESVNGSLEELEEGEQEERVEEEEYENETTALVQEKYFGPPPKGDHEIPVKLTRNEASDCLTNIGAIFEGGHHAFLTIDAASKNLTNISVIPTFKHVMFVNVSDNRLRTEDVLCLASMEHLLSLKANKNRITSAKFPLMKYIQEIDLNENYIQSTEFIIQPILECLSLNSNQLKEVVGMNSSDLPCLTHLELRGNSLRNVNGIDFPKLNKLYLAENFIESLEGINKLVNLKILHLRGNKISLLDGFTSDMKELMYLNLRKCEIRDLQELTKIASLPKLIELKVMENPFTIDAEEDYRAEILAIMPKLKKIDKTKVLPAELIESQQRKDLEEEDEDEDDEN